MNKKLFIATLLLGASFTHLSGQESPFFELDDKVLVIDNGVIQREILLDDGNGGIHTRSLKLSGEEFNFMDVEQPTAEFRFSVYNISLSGLSKWQYQETRFSGEEAGGASATSIFRGYGIMSVLELQLIYTVYPDLPVIRKQLRLVNNGNKEVMVEELDVEALTLKARPTGTELYTNYSRHKHLGPYEGDWDDPAIALHLPGLRKGVVIGNEAPGVLKRIAYYQDGRDLSAGMTHPDQDFPFRAWLGAGEFFTSPAVFLLLYTDADSPYTALNFTLPDYVKRHMGLEIFRNAYKPVFVYNTWNPFRKQIDAGMIAELAEAAEECGIREFVIDDGWQVNEFTDEAGDLPWWYTQVGDYLIDNVKFPNGLRPVFDDIKEKGMEPGLWLSIGSASTTAAVFREHPEWYVQDPEGATTNLHDPGNMSMRTACMSTGWTNHIRDIIVDLTREHGLTYTKLDFATVTSAYSYDPAIAGCYAEDHAGHHDQAESFISNYRGLFGLFDELQEEAPDLFIDCTFETLGKLHMADYAFLKHAEGNWLSNIEEAPPSGALRVRHLAWQRTPIIPASTLVVGNLRLDSPELEFDFFSLLGTFPIMLGDIREVPASSREWLKGWSDWMEEMQQKYDYLSYRQDLVGFGEPAEGRWDGWQRINTENLEGGIVGVFRQGAVESSRTLTVQGLDDEAEYAVIDADQGDTIGAFSGNELAAKGFRVEMQRLYQGKIFEVSRVEGK